MEESERGLRFSVPADRVKLTVAGEVEVRESDTLKAVDERQTELISLTVSPLPVIESSVSGDAAHECFAPDPRLPENFTSVQYVGEGGMSYVYSAIDTASDGMRVAVKLLKKELSRDPRIIERFNREAHHVQQLVHPNVVRVLSTGASKDGIPFIVCEYMDGGTLEDAILADGPLPAARSMKIFQQVCAAVEAAHRKMIIHRDIKPSNILLTQDEDGTEIAKLSDFGIIKTTAYGEYDPNLTGTGVILGSPAYMSPEQCKGGEIDNRSDIYS
ncbi:MAG: serine/threonine protein kinase, partial [Cyanobacteria bacterium]|nr:serine/threonine protein kinase [Cyanobacteriota bacterium]